MIPANAAKTDDKTRTFTILSIIKGVIVHFSIMKSKTKYAVLMISITTIELNPECHPGKIFASSQPKTKRSNPSIESFSPENLIRMTAKGHRIKKTNSGRPIGRPMKLNSRD